MHEAYIVYNPENILVPIESIVSYDNNVIIGTRPGHLLMYTFNPNPDERKAGLSLLHYNKSFSDKPIKQIDVIPEYHLLFSLSNDVISVNDLNRHNFPLVHRSSETKGASLFALEVQRSRSLTGETALMVRICVAVKRKLQLWYWKNEIFMPLYDDIDLSDVPKSVMLAGNTICVGLKSEYLLYNIAGEKSQKCELFPTGSARDIDPCISLIKDHFAVAKDEYLIAVYPENKKQEQVPAAGSSGKAANFPADQDVSNTFKSLVWSQSIRSLIWDEPYAVALTKGSLEVRVLNASESDKDTLIQTLPDLQNARFLLRSKQRALVVASTTTLWYIEAVDIPKQRQLLLQQKKFHLCLQLTNVSDESEEEKKERSYQIQTIYAFDLFENKFFKESMAEFMKLNTDPCDVIRLFPNLLTSATTPAATPTTGFVPTNQPILETRDLENGLLALIDYLVLVRYNAMKQLDPKSATGDIKPLGSNPTQLLSIIDTTLLKCYLQTNDSMVPSLIRRNYCHFEESEKTLKQYRKLDELKILYQYKGHHKKALQLLQSEANIPGSPLAGHEWTINYLQQLENDNKRIVFEFAGWVLDKHPIDGLKIFTEDLVETNRLARAEVLDYLMKNHSGLVIPYLEHIIHVWGEEKQLFHNILIQQYLAKIQGLKTDSPSKHTSQLATTRATLKEFLLKSSDYAQDQALKIFPLDDLFEERAIILGKLGMHEKVIAIYLQINGNLQGAADYCEQVHQADSSNDTIYVSLIRALLTVPTNPPYSGVALHPNCLKPNTEFVLSLLETHSNKINALAVLQILPGSVPLIRLKNFLEHALRSQQEKRRLDQITKGLLSSENLQLQEELMLLQARSVTLTEQSVCPVCNKRFTNQSAFVRNPDGQIVHYSCQEKP